ncbi:MAG: DUF4383 domain-containing protein [Candidatus Pacebacteria bacterium]|nr:DUF4383 domain-containing protein [Candidatus Paceibacterota bacterium]
MNTKTWAWIFAVVFLAIGILGFVPGITTADGHLLGIFHVDAMHNIIHLITGVIALFVAMGSGNAQKMFFKIFGVIYAVVAIAGLVWGGNVFGLIHTNTADDILHVVIALIALYAGFGGGKKKMMNDMPAQGPQM